MSSRMQSPKISCEPEADILRLEISDQSIDYASEIGNVIVHFNSDDTPVYLEFLQASEFIEDLSQAVKADKKVVA